jgi:hypothetical protein
MKERPILFSGEMVRAILEGRKTMTRRVVKDPICTNKEIYGEDGGLTWYGNFGLRKPCKFGAVGDRLWVKETFCQPTFEEKCFYRADMPIHIDRKESGLNEDIDFVDSDFKWKPSIFMPRWASRITLEIVSVRVERLQDITEKDAKEEGIKQVTCGLDETCFEYARNENAYSTAKQAFEALWKKINGAESWVANPWVWVIEFKKVEVAK